MRSLSPESEGQATLEQGSKHVSLNPMELAPPWDLPLAWPESWRVNWMMSICHWIGNLSHTQPSLPFSHPYQL